MFLKQTRVDKWQHQKSNFYLCKPKQLRINNSNSETNINNNEFTNRDGFNNCDEENRDREFNNRDEEFNNCDEELTNCDGELTNRDDEEFNNRGDEEFNNCDEELNNRDDEEFNNRDEELTNRCDTWFSTLYVKSESLPLFTYSWRQEDNSLNKRIV